VYFNVNFNVLFKLIKVDLFVSELYFEILCPFYLHKYKII